MLNLIYMLERIICNLFEHKVGRMQGVGWSTEEGVRKALLVCFRTKKKFIRMLIYAPGNYVGVYVRVEKGNWDCLVYHDSCWRESGVHTFLYNNREDLSFYPFAHVSTKGFEVKEELTDSIYIVQLDEIQEDGLMQIQKKKFK